MEAVATAASVAGIFTTALSLGQKLIESYHDLKEGRAEILERIVEVRAQWHRTVVQLGIMERVWPSLSEEFQSIQEEILNQLIIRLEHATVKLNGFLRKESRVEAQEQQIERPAVKRWKYLLLKPHLDETIKSLDKWQKMYDPSWFLILKIADPVIDAELGRNPAARPVEAKAKAVLRTATKVRGALNDNPSAKVHIFLSREGLDKAVVNGIKYSSAQYVQRPGASTLLIIDPVPCEPGSSLHVMEADIRKLATRLHYVDPFTFGVLKCHGVLKTFKDDSSRLSSFEMVFETPTRDLPRTLRSCLTQRIPHTLTERLDLAKQMAKSINYVHTLNFVHKNVRPENMLGFSNTEAQLGSFFLIGFQQVRSADGLTYWHGDDLWEQNLYRHPDRQGPHPEESYRMQHDIYSLGVCLLEIGLWQSFVTYEEDGKVKAPLDIIGLSLEDFKSMKPRSVKHHLESLATRELARVMGELYEQVVVTCLTCLDDDNVDFGDPSEFDDADGVSVGLRYIDKVILKLNSISL